jgi:hypothetical protein
MSALYESYMIEAMIENYLLVFLFTAIAAIVTNKLLVKSLILPLPEIQYPINSDPDFEISEGVLIEYKGTAAVVVIPEGVTRIGDRAFYHCTGLTSITIGNSVTSIGDWAFMGCTGLTSVIIPNSVTSIGLGAFEGCTGLTSVTIPNSVTSIGWRAFDGCTGLTSVTIPNSVTSMAAYAFEGCTGLTSITIGNSVTSIGAYAFSYCTGLTSITIPDSVTSIGVCAFESCTGLTSVTIPNSVTSIGRHAFYDCRGLRSITIPDCVTSIDGSAFSYCTGLTSVTIGNSVTSIGRRAFNGCTNLRRISVPAHFTDQQILDLRLPLECIIKRRELAILPPWYELKLLADTNNFQLNRVDQAVRNLLIAFSMCMECYPVKLPERVMTKLYKDHLRREYLPSSEITKARLADTPDSQERKDKVAAYEQEVSLLLTNSLEQGG